MRMAADNIGGSESDLPMIYIFGFISWSSRFSKLVIAAKLYSDHKTVKIRYY